MNTDLRFEIDFMEKHYCNEVFKLYFPLFFLTICNFLKTYLVMTSHKSSNDRKNVLLDPLYFLMKLPSRDKPLNMPFVIFFTWHKNCLDVDFLVLLLYKYFTQMKSFTFWNHFFNIFWRNVWNHYWYSHNYLS